MPAGKGFSKPDKERAKKETPLELRKGEPSPSIPMTIGSERVGYGTAVISELRASQQSRGQRGTTDKLSYTFVDDFQPFLYLGIPEDQEKESPRIRARQPVPGKPEAFAKPWFTQQCTAAGERASMKGRTPRTRLGVPWVSTNQILSRAYVCKIFDIICRASNEHKRTSPSPAAVRSFVS